MSEQIDWSKAPEGATHYVVGSISPFEMRDGDDWFFWNSGSGKWVRLRGFLGNERFNEQELEIIQRPTTPSWSGEGLPPAGVDIEVLHELYGWIGARVVGQDGEAAIVRTNDGYAGAFPHQFRPIRTPEQVAADERDAAIKEIEELIAGYSYRHCAELIHDKGYRKP